MTDCKTARDQNSARDYYDIGQAYRASGQLDLAQDAFESALAIDPAFAGASLGLGQTCYDLGRSSEALHHLERALQSEPNNADTLCYCGKALADLGHRDLSLEFARKAIEAAPDELGHKLAAIGVLQGIEFKTEYPWYEQFLGACLDDPQLAHPAVTPVALSLLWVKPAMQSAVAATQLDSSHLAALAQEPLLLLLLSRTIVASWAFETFFTRLRRTLAQTGDRSHLKLMAAVAEQAFNAGYVQYQSDDEVDLEHELLQKDAASLTAVELVTLASYRPLADAPDAAKILDRPDLPDAILPVVDRTLREPLRERQIQSRIVTLTPIRNAVSRRVREQYEEHPYPFWTGLAAVSDRHQRLVDEVTRHALNFDGAAWPDRPKALVPGCGTGYHPLHLAHKHPETDVLAIDLSLRSLAYAIRKQEELKLTNVRFCQADLLQLGDSSERYQYIDCAGVLHHLESPLEGWQVLTRLLEPGGVMRVGLYSELARKTVVAAREKIAARRISSTPSAIRDFRRAIMSDPELADLRSLARATSDFFGMGEVRDLMFHVQEHRFDLRTISRHLGVLGLEFGGLLISNRNAVRDFYQHYPARSQWLDLECWAEFETRYPDTFRGMYQFYCLKPGPELTKRDRAIVDDGRRPV